METISKETGYFTSYDETEIYYETRGEGKPLIFAYGIACSANHWHHQISHFSRNYRAIFFDYRGHHRTTIPKDHDELTISALGRDVVALCDHLKIKKAVFLGHSFGCPVLLRAYEAQPSLFKGLVFVNGFARNPVHGMFGTDIIPTLFRLVNRGHSFLPETLNFVWQKAVNNRLAMQLTALTGGFNVNLTHLKDIEIYLKGVSSIHLEVFLKLFQDMIDHDARSVLDQVEAPTLLIAGDKDAVTPIRFQEELHKKIRGSEFLKIPYGSHCTQLDMPDFINLKIESFLRKLRW